MLRFNELRLTPDGKYLIIEVQVDNCSWYKDCYIEEVQVYTRDLYKPAKDSQLRPVLRPVYSLQKDGGQDKRHCDEMQEGILKRTHIKVPVKALSSQVPNQGLFFVKAYGGGYPEPECPCGSDTSTIQGAAFSLQPFYKATMKYLRELSDTCQTPKGLIDMILRLKALEFSLKTGDYVKAVEYWEYLIEEIRSVNLSNCGCHG